MSNKTFRVQKYSWFPIGEVWLLTAKLQVRSILIPRDFCRWDYVKIPFNLLIAVN